MENGPAYDRILAELTEMRSQLSGVVATMDGWRANIERFWSRSWPDMEKQVADVDNRVRALEVRMAEQASVIRAIEDHERRIRTAELTITRLVFLVLGAGGVGAVTSELLRIVLP